MLAGRSMFSSMFYELARASDCCRGSSRPEPTGPGVWMESGARDWRHRERWCWGKQLELDCYAGSSLVCSECPAVYWRCVGFYCWLDPNI